MGEQALFIVGQCLHGGLQVNILGVCKRRLHMLATDRHKAFAIGTGCRSPDQVQADPEISAGRGLVGDEVQDLVRECAGIEGFADPVLQDTVDFVPGIGREVDLHGMEYGHHARVKFPGEIRLHVADRDHDPRLSARICFVEAQDIVEDVVEQLSRQKIIRIIEADREDHLLVHEIFSYPVEDVPTRTSQWGRGMPEHLAVNPR